MQTERVYVKPPPSHVDRFSTPSQAVGFDGHVRGVLSELEGVFQVFEDVTDVRYDHARVSTISGDGTFVPQDTPPGQGERVGTLPTYCFARLNLS